MEREAGQEPVPARLQAAEPDSCDADKAGLLRDDLHIAQTLEELNVRAGQLKRVLVGVREEALERVLPARVPHVAGDQPGATLRAGPDLRRHDVRLRLLGRAPS
jgi:hypothetical protein